MKKLIAIAILSVATTASAEPDRDDVIATQPFELFARGAAVSYEHALNHRFSLMVVGGLRGAAEGDFSSTTLTVGAEARLWLRPRDPIALGGPYVGLHASIGHTSLTERATDMDLGTSWGIAQHVDLGWRFTIRHRVAITPSVGFGVREDVDGAGRLAPAARGVMLLGLELGWML